MDQNQEDTLVEKTLVCLANSRKISGRCIAGKELNGNNVGHWIRPISGRPNHEISEEDRRYEDGSTATVFDIINIRFKGKANNPVQSENYEIDENYYWGNIGKFSGNLNTLIDQPSALWNNNDSSYYGINDRVHSLQIPSPIQSLYFIVTNNLNIIVQTEGAEFGNGKRKVRANFVYNGITYRISVTDPVIESYYLKQGEGTYTPSGNIYMTVSLGDAYNDHHYKLAAGIFGINS